MMELRWIDREAWDEAKNEGLGRRERVLQYREMKGTSSYGWWEEWKEVPTIKED